jgi:hypothetical protein
MWPFKQLRELREDVDLWKGAHDVARAHWLSCLSSWESANKEIADLKDSNARLADALAAAKERAGDTYGP